VSSELNVSRITEGRIYLDGIAWSVAT